MPIIVTDSHGNVSAQYVGCVVRIDRSKQHRNLSDTLDFSDYQTVDAVEALVYMGRVEKAWNQDQAAYLDQPRPISRTFQHVDCTNSFVWRGSDKRVPHLDTVFHPDLVEDWIAYVEWEAAEKAKKEEAQVQAKLADEQCRAEEERNRPVVGKQMKVVSGRKVPRGTEGTVAYIGDRGVLLKPDASWKDRATDGVWVDARHLKAR